MEMEGQTPGSSVSSIGEQDNVAVGAEDGVIRKVNIIRINPFSSNLPSFFPKLLNTKSTVILLTMDRMAHVHHWTS